MTFTSLDHPAIACYDVRKLSTWYCKTFGMNIIAQNDADPPAMVIGYGETLTGGAMIEMMPVKDAGPNPAECPRFQPGIRHIALRVTDFEKAHAQLKEAGVTFTTPVGEAVGGGKTILFRDPEGNELQIIQR